MPALLWVLFWSSMMAGAACFGDLAEAPAEKYSESSGDHPAV
jgi:hypothetical protein